MKVNLIDKALGLLNDTAALFSIEPERAFEYTVRNALHAYHTFDFGGYFLVIDKAGNKGTLQLRENQDTHAFSTFARFLDRFRSERQAKILNSTSITVQIDEKVFADITLQAQVFGFTLTDFINRLVIVGSVLGIHLQSGGYAWAYSKDGRALGKVEFE